MDSFELIDSNIQDNIINNETQKTLDIFFDNTLNNEKISNDIIDSLDYLDLQEEDLKDSLDFAINQQIYIKHSIINLILTIILGGIGIPAIFYKKKLFGIIVFVAGIISLTIGLLFNFWYLFIFNVLMYTFELSWSIHMVAVCIYNKNCVRKFSIKSKSESEDTYFFTEL